MEGVVDCHQTYNLCMINMILYNVNMKRLCYHIALDSMEDLSCMELSNKIK